MPKFIITMKDESFYEATIEAKDYAEAKSKAYEMDIVEFGDSVDGYFEMHSIKEA